MDITVTIPNGKVGNIVAALSAQPPPGWTPPPQGATAAQVRDHIAAHLSAQWKDELRDLLRNHRRSQTIAAAVEADKALPDPLA